MALKYNSAGIIDASRPSGAWRFVENAVLAALVTSLHVAIAFAMMGIFGLPL